MAKIIRIVDFAKERNVDPQVIGAWMKRHDMPYDKTKGLTKKQIEQLSEQYPPITEVIAVDNESREALIQAQQDIIRLQAEIVNLTKRSAKLELLEDLSQRQQEQMQELQEQISAKDTEISIKDNDLSTKDAELEEAKKEIERLKSRGFWDRLFNR